MYTSEIYDESHWIYIEGLNGSFAVPIVGSNFSRHNDPLKPLPVDSHATMRDNRTNGPGMAEVEIHK